MKSIRLIWHVSHWFPTYESRLVEGYIAHQASSEPKVRGFYYTTWWPWSPCRAFLFKYVCTYICMCICIYKNKFYIYIYIFFSRTLSKFVTRFCSSPLCFSLLGTISFLRYLLSFLSFFLFFFEAFCFLRDIQISSVTQLCPTLCDPMDCSTPGLPVHHQFPEFTQTHVHWVSDAIQPPHPLSSPSPPAISLSQHQSLFKWVSSSQKVAKVLEFHLQHQSFQWIFRTDFR